MARGASTEIDELFRLPLTEFTAARNALAKRAGKDGAAIRALTKPPLAAWAVNQLYWQDRDTYEDLVRAAGEMRRAHKSVIEGKRGDLRSAGREHELALEAAVKATHRILKNAGQPVSDTTRQAILNTLRALPAAEPPGRLTQALAPGGFEMLAGVALQPSAPAGRKSSASAPAARGRTGPATKGDRDADEAEREAAKLREQKAAAQRAVREADQRARQAEFEVARTRRDATKAERRLEQARRALDEAQAELADAEREAVRALKAREAAEARSEQANTALEQARSSPLL
jgi:hypothetical protein